MKCTKMDTNWLSALRSRVKRANNEAVKCSEWHCKCTLYRRSRCWFSLPCATHFTGCIASHCIRSSLLLLSRCSTWNLCGEILGGLGMGVCEFLTLIAVDWRWQETKFCVTIWINLIKYFSVAWKMLRLISRSFTNYFITFIRLVSIILHPRISSQLCNSANHFISSSFETLFSHPLIIASIMLCIMQHKRHQRKGWKVATWWKAFERQWMQFLCAHNLNQRGSISELTCVELKCKVDWLWTLSKENF